MSTAQLVTAVVRAVEEGPEPEDVVAGWTAFAIFIGLIVAVVVLGISLTRRLKNVDCAAEEGKYDPSSRRRTQSRTPTIPTSEDRP